MNKGWLFSLMLFGLIQVAYAQTNEFPVATDFADTVVMSELPLELQFDASSSNDPDGSIENYYWVVNEDTVAETVLADIQVINKETTIKLIVEDDQGASDQSGFKVFVGHPTNHGLNRIYFNNGAAPVFLSGMNIAWYRYARDLEMYDDDAQAYFEELMDSISMNGGNALRWWIHTNGAHSPLIDTSGYVTGLTARHIQNLKQILDLAFDHDIAISMCLWSFDMLQGNQQQNVSAMKKLLEDPENIQSYIDNALLPILEKLGDHPAVATWEIFNEPEGMTRQFGWTTGDRVGMFEVQRFVNLCAGAIQRNSPSALVSNGSWSFRASSDVGNGNKNYYSDEELIMAGGDPDGVLDFYQVHYYPEHFGNVRSPFHRPADYWGLDKPIVIGEFPADTIDGRARPHLSIKQAYQRAVAYGYAGAMSWSWSSTGDFNRDFSAHTAEGLKQVRALIPDALRVPNDGVQIDRIPKIMSQIPAYRMLLPDVQDSLSFIELSEVFSDNQVIPLQYSIDDITGSPMVTPELNEGVLGYRFESSEIGMSTVTVRAEDSAGWYSRAEGLVMVGDPNLRTNNLAYFQKIEASDQNQDHQSVFANDGDNDTYWESSGEDNQWLVLDFEQNQTFNFLAIDWRGLSAVEYAFEISDDGENWQEIYSTTSATGRSAAIALEDEVNSRYLKLLMTRTNGSDYRIEELMVQHVIDNQAPEIIGQVEDYTIIAGDVIAKNNYARFDDIFTDAEHSKYLNYEVQSSNEDLVKALLSTGNVGVNLSFGSKNAGTATITLTAIDPFGAEASLSFDVHILEPLGDLGANEQITVFPNPTGDQLVVTAEETTRMISYRLIDTQGKEYYVDGKIEGQFFELDMKSLSKGIYILMIRTSTGIDQYRVIRD